MSIRDLDSAPVVDFVVGVPGWVLRLGLLAAGLGLAATAPGRGSGPVVVGILVATAAGTALFPGSPAPIVLMSLACAVRIFTGHDEVGGRLLGCALLLAPVHVLSAIAAVVPWRARLDPRALLPSARRFGLVVLASIPIGLAARFVGPGSGSSLLFLLAALGCAALVGLALLVGGARGPQDLPRRSVDPPR